MASALAFSMWFYVQRVLIPHQQRDAALHARPRGNLSDLYPRWLGARELLLHHRNPYSADVTREIQIGYYGRALDASRPEDPKDQQAFAYPVYVALLLAPIVTSPFDLVQAWFQPFLVAVVGATALLWLRAIQWRPPLAATIILMVLSLGSFPASQGIKLQQLSVVVSALIAGTVALVVSGHLMLAGILLALATIKPQLALPLAGWLALWTLGNWRQRWKFVLAFAVSMAFLLGAAEILLPGWLGSFRAAICSYREYTGGGRSLLSILLRPTWGTAATVIVLLTVSFMCWRMRFEPPQDIRFAVTTSLVVASTVVVIPMFAPYNQLLLLPGVFLLIRLRRSFWRKNRWLRAFWWGGALMIIWPWFAAAVLALASLAMPAQLIENAWALPLYTSLTIPVVICGLLLSMALDGRLRDRTVPTLQ